MAKATHHDQWRSRRKNFGATGKRLSDKKGRAVVAGKKTTSADAPNVEMRITLISDEPPRTKKNDQRIVRVGRFTKILPSKAFERWQKTLEIQGWDEQQLADIPWECSAIIYREKKVGDLINYLQAVADALQHWGVISDDKWIMSWDGSRLDKDAENPRVELVLRPLIITP